jgi:hypothetical protein
MKKFTVSEDVEIVANGQRILLEKGDKIVINEETDLSNAIQSGDLEAVKTIMNSITPENVDFFDDRGALETAVQSGDINMVKILLATEERLRRLGVLDGRNLFDYTEGLQQIWRWFAREVLMTPL